MLGSCAVSVLDLEQNDRCCALRLQSHHPLRGISHSDVSLSIYDIKSRVRLDEKEQRLFFLIKPSLDG